MSVVWLRSVLLLRDADLPQGRTQSGHLMLGSHSAMDFFVPGRGNVRLERSFRVCFSVCAFIAVHRADPVVDQRSAAAAAWGRSTSATSPIR